MKQEKINHNLFAQRLRALMSKRKFTQQQVADAVGLSRVAVVKWLKGSYPGSAELYRLSKFFGVEMQWFFDSIPHKGTAALEIEKMSVVKVPVDHFTLDELRRLGRSIQFLESEHEKELGAKGKLKVDNGVRDDSLASVKREVPTWKELKRDILNLTTERGQRKALADELGISKQVLGNWLSHGRKGGPNAEQTLWLFHWVKQRKGKQ